MTKPRSLLRLAAALSLAAFVSPSLEDARAALPMRTRGAATPSAPASAMVMPLPMPPPPPAPTAPPSITDLYPRYGQSLSPEVIRRVIWVHVNQIRYCYQQALFKQPTLAGRLVMNFLINPQGQVVDLSVRETTLQSPQLLGCICDTMRTWEFPPTPTYDGITEINYPFLLRPRVPEIPPGIQISDAELERLGIFKDPEPPAVDILF